MDNDRQIILLNIAFATFMLTIIIVLYILCNKSKRKITAHDSTDSIDSKNSNQSINPLSTTIPIKSTYLTQDEFNALSESDKLQYVIDKYFMRQGPPTETEKINYENKYIDSLPKDSTSCVDFYNDCPKWAKNGECKVNPEYMLYNCKASCSACKLNPQEQYNVTSIYNSRDPPSCVYHGFNYPGPLEYRFDVLNY